MTPEQTRTIERLRLCQSPAELTCFVVQLLGQQLEFFKALSDAAWQYDAGLIGPDLRRLHARDSERGCELEKMITVLDFTMSEIENHLIMAILTAHYRLGRCQKLDELGPSWTACSFAVGGKRYVVHPEDSTPRDGHARALLTVVDWEDEVSDADESAERLAPLLTPPAKPKRKAKVAKA
jgi:hypothetical protein